MSVLPGEKLTRFIRYGSHFSDEANTVKREAFLPHKNSSLVGESSFPLNDV